MAFSLNQLTDLASQAIDTLYDKHPDHFHYSSKDMAKSVVSRELENLQRVGTLQGLNPDAVSQAAQMHMVGLNNLEQDILTSPTNTQETRRLIQTPRQNALTDELVKNLQNKAPIEAHGLEALVKPSILPTRLRTMAEIDKIEIGSTRALGFLWKNRVELGVRHLEPQQIEALRTHLNETLAPSLRGDQIGIEGITRMRNGEPVTFVQKLVVPIGANNVTPEAVQQALTDFKPKIPDRTPFKWGESTPAAAAETAATIETKIAAEVAEIVKLTPALGSAEAIASANAIPLENIPEHLQGLAQGARGIAEIPASQFTGLIDSAVSSGARKATYGAAALGSVIAAQHVVAETKPAVSAPINTIALEEVPERFQGMAEAARGTITEPSLKIRLAESPAPKPVTVPEFTSVAPVQTLAAEVAPAIGSAEAIAKAAAIPMENIPEHMQGMVGGVRGTVIEPALTPRLADAPSTTTARLRTSNPELATAALPPTPTVTEAITRAPINTVALEEVPERFQGMAEAARGTITEPSVKIRLADTPTPKPIVTSQATATIAPLRTAATEVAPVLGSAEAVAKAATIPLEEIPEHMRGMVSGVRGTIETPASQFFGLVDAPSTHISRTVRTSNPELATAALPPTTVAPAVARVDTAAAEALARANAIALEDVPERFQGMVEGARGLSTEPSVKIRLAETPTLKPVVVPEAAAAIAPVQTVIAEVAPVTVEAAAIAKAAAIPLEEIPERFQGMVSGVRGTAVEPALTPRLADAPSSAPSRLRTSNPELATAMHIPEVPPVAPEIKAVAQPVTRIAAAELGTQAGIERAATIDLETIPEHLRDMVSASRGVPAASTPASPFQGLVDAPSASRPKQLRTSNPGLATATSADLASRPAPIVAAAPKSRVPYTGGAVTGVETGALAGAKRKLDGALSLEGIALQNERHWTAPMGAEQEVLKAQVLADYEAAQALKGHTHAAFTELETSAIDHVSGKSYYPQEAWDAFQSKMGELTPQMQELETKFASGYSTQGAEALAAGKPTITSIFQGGRPDFGNSALGIKGTLATDIGEGIGRLGIVTAGAAAVTVPVIATLKDIAPQGIKVARAGGLLSSARRHAAVDVSSLSEAQAATLKHHLEEEFKAAPGRVTMKDGKLIVADITPARVEKTLASLKHQVLDPTAGMHTPLGTKPAAAAIAPEVLTEVGPFAEIAEQGRNARLTSKGMKITPAATALAATIETPATPESLAQAEHHGQWADAVDGKLPVAKPVAPKPVIEPSTLKPASDKSWKRGAESPTATAAFAPPEPKIKPKVKAAPAAKPEPGAFDFLKNPEGKIISQETTFLKEAAARAERPGLLRRAASGILRGGNAAVGGTVGLVTGSASLLKNGIVGGAGLTRDVAVGSVDLMKPMAKISGKGIVNLAKGTHGMASNLILAGAATAAVVAAGAAIPTSQRVRVRENYLNHDDEGIAFGQTSSVDLGGIAMPSLGQGQNAGSWVSRLPSMEEQQASMQDFVKR